MKEFAQWAFEPGSTIISDGYGSYIPVLENFTHKYEPYAPNAHMLHWLHIAISKAKAFILGTYHGLPKKHLQSYLDEFCFPFSRHFLWFRLYLQKLHIFTRRRIEVVATSLTRKRVTTSELSF